MGSALWLGASIMVHGAVLALVLRSPVQPMRAPEAASFARTSSGVVHEVDLTVAIAPAPQDKPVPRDQPEAEHAALAVGADQSPSEVPAAVEAKKTSETKPIQQSSKRPAKSPTSKDLAAEVGQPAPEKTGIPVEDWLRLEDQLPAPVPALSARSQAPEQTQDRLVQRLMAAERRKREQALADHPSPRRTAPNHRQTRSKTDPPPATSPHKSTSVSKDLGQVLALGMARAFPIAADDTDPSWRQTPLGLIGRLDFSLEIDDGKLRRSSPSKIRNRRLARLLARTLSLLSVGRWSVSSPSLPSGTRHFSLRISLRPSPDDSFRLLREPTHSGAEWRSAVLVQGQRLLEAHFSLREVDGQAAP